MTPTPPVPNGNHATPAGNSPETPRRAHIPHGRDEVSFGSGRRPGLRGWRKLALPLLLALGLIPAAAAIGGGDSPDQHGTGGTPIVKEHQPPQDDSKPLLSRSKRATDGRDLAAKQKASGDGDGVSDEQERLYDESQQQIRDHLFLEEDK